MLVCVFLLARVVSCSASTGVANMLTNVILLIHVKASLNLIFFLLVNDCEPNPCARGVCFSHESLFNFQCPTGFTGKMYKKPGILPSEKNSDDVCFFMPPQIWVGGHIEFPLSVRPSCRRTFALSVRRLICVACNSKRITTRVIELPNNSCQHMILRTLVF